MKDSDVLLAGHRPGETDGLKIKYFPKTGAVRVSLLARNGTEALGFELDGIADLEELGRTIMRAVERYRELFPAQENYLSEIRKILAPQTENHTATLLNAR
jgi:hypothetical protein